MAHWGWYWKIKKQHTPRVSCENMGLMEIDSFKMFNNYQQVEAARKTHDKCSLYIPKYDLKAYLQEDDGLLVEYRNGTYVIPVEHKPCNYGGYCYFFNCPLCNKRMRKLYCLDGQYLCRKCGNLAYYTQRLRPAERCMLMGIKLSKHVQNLDGDIGTDLKPPRMHRTTFKAFQKRREYYQARYGLASFKEGRKWFGSKVEAWLDSCSEQKWKDTIAEYEKHSR